MDLQRLRRWLQAEEGLSRVAYADSRGLLTIGYGHALSRPLSLRACELILDDDVADTIGQLAIRFPWVDGLDDVRACVLADMAFNLGTAGLAAFTKVMGAVQSGDYGIAADEMLNSRWSLQVGARAHTLAERMRTGQE